jgi:hypothetical protein
MATAIIDPAMEKIREIWAKKQTAGMTLLELGEAMQYGTGAAATSAAHQFLRGNDPRVSSLRRFARAVGVSPASLVR